VFSFSLFSRIFSIAWKFLFNLGIFRDKILGFLKNQSGTTATIGNDYLTNGLDCLDGLD